MESPEINVLEEPDWVALPLTLEVAASVVDVTELETAELEPVGEGDEAVFKILFAVNWSKMLFISRGEAPVCEEAELIARL